MIYHTINHLNLSLSFFTPRFILFPNLRLIRSRLKEWNLCTYSSDQSLRLSNLGCLISLPIDILIVLMYQSIDFNQQIIYIPISPKLIDRHMILTIISLSKDTNQQIIPYLWVYLGHRYSFKLTHNLLIYVLQVFVYLNSLRIVKSLSIPNQLDVSQTSIQFTLLLPGFINHLFLA